MSLPSQSRISFARINENVRFTGGNLGINTTNPTSTLDVSGTARITTSITSGAVYATNSTVTNSVATNVSSGTLNLSTGITSASAQITNSNVTTQTIGTAIVTTNLLAIGNSNTVGNIFTTGGNVGIGTNIPAAKLSIVGSAYDGVGTIRLYPSTYNSRVVMGFMSGESTGSYWTMGKQDGFNFGIALSTNLASGISFSETNISCGPLTTTSLTTGSILATTSISSGVLNATNSTVTNVVATNVSSGTLNLTTGLTAGSAQITNSNVTTETIGTARITTSLLAIGNSNTVGNIFTTGGNVGINTTSPTAKLNVVGDTVIQSGGLTVKNANGYGSFELSGTVGSYIDFGPDTNDYRTRILHTESDRSFNFFVNGGTNTTMTLASTGNVGIGTASPSAKLHVQGDTLGGIYNTTSVTNGNILLTNNIGGGVIQFHDIHHSIWGRKGYDNQTDVLQIREFDQIQFWTGGLIQNQSIRMTIGSTGNVGIGTASPTVGLEVYNAISSIVRTSGPVAGQQGFNISDTASRWSMYKPSNSIDLRFYDGTDDRVTFANGGNVGIGTVSPGYKLDVNGSFATNTMLIRSTSYITSLANQVYNGNTWYTAIAPGILTTDATYIVSLSFVAGATPWNIYASFLHMIGYTNDNQPLSTSGANVPTTIHANNSNGVDYQIKVRGSYAPNSSGGIQFSVNGTTPSGYWTVKAYRII